MLSITRAQLEAIFARRFRDENAQPIAYVANLQMQIELRPKEGDASRDDSKRGIKYSVLINLSPFPGADDQYGYSSYFEQRQLVTSKGLVRYMTLAQVNELLARSGVVCRVNMQIEPSSASGLRYSLERQAKALQRFTAETEVGLIDEREKLEQYASTLSPDSPVAGRVQARIQLINDLLQTAEQVRGWIA